MSSDAEYFRRRASEERAHADLATAPNIAAIHLKLAEKYEALAHDAERGQTLSPGWDEGPATA